MPILLDTFLEALYFPLWWYSRGLKKTAIFCLKKIKDGWRALALSILLINFFKPMYGQKGFAAYILSISVHFWQSLIRLILMFLWLALWFLVLIIWIFFPLFIIWQLIL
ncbi:MAG: hypothetical protein ABH889_00555 [Candidatus Portnoybacteria bacterium]